MQRVVAIGERGDLSHGWVVEVVLPRGRRAQEEDTVAHVGDGV